RLRTSQVRDIADRLESSPELTAHATRTLLNSAGARPRSILATLGAGGAVLSVPYGCWHCQNPQVDDVCIVDAVDSTLSRYLSTRSPAPTSTKRTRTRPAMWLTEQPPPVCAAQDCQHRQTPGSTP